METEEAGTSTNRTTGYEPMHYIVKVKDNSGPIIIGNDGCIRGARETDSEGKAESPGDVEDAYELVTSSQQQGFGSVASYLENIKESLNHFDEKNGPLWEKEQKYILELVLPDQEKRWKDSSSRTNIYETLAKLSCSKSSSQVVQSSLELLWCLVKVDNDLADGESNLRRVEEIVRLSINSPSAVFKIEGYRGQERRISLYSHMLTIMVIQKTKGRLRLVNEIQDQLLQLKKYLKKEGKCGDHQAGDFLECSLKIIRKCVTFLSNSSSKDKIYSRMKAFLCECQEKLDKGKQEGMELSFLPELRQVGKNIKQYWFAVYCVIFHLFGKVHRSTEKPAMLLLKRVIDAYIEGGGGDDQNFSCQAAWLLSDVAKTHISIETREVAEDCLRGLEENKKVQENQSYLRGIVERFSSKVSKVFSKPGKEEPPLMKSDNVDGYTDQQQEDSTRYQGFFSHNKPHMITKEKDRAGVRQRIRCRGDEQLPPHWNKLLAIKNPNIGLNCITYSDADYRIMDIISPEATFGNLKEYALDGRCRQHEHIFQILSQVASAQCYLHENHTVHGDLRAEHVYVTGPCEVKLVCLGRSKSLSVLKTNEDNSTSWVVYDNMHKDSIRWSAPEVILEGLYSHASDMWAFGVLVWELFAALQFGRDAQDKTIPYYERQDDEILECVKNGGLLPTPPCCPTWIAKMMGKCWSKRREDRPPSAEPLAAFTFVSGLSWPKKEAVWNAMKPEKRPPKQEIYKMCSTSNSGIRKEDERRTRKTCTI